MSSIFRLTRLQACWFELIEQYPKQLLAIIMGLVIVAAAGLPRLSFSSDFRVYFGPDNPQLAAFEQMETDFSKQDNLLFVVHHPQQSIFSQQGFRLLHQLTELGWQIPYSQRVDSLQNQQWITANDDTLFIDDFFAATNIEQLSDENFAQLLAQAQSDQQIRRKLIDDHGTTAVVNIIVALPEEGLAATAEIIAASDLVINSLAQSYPGWVIQRAGSIPSNHTMGQAIRGDIENLIALTFVVMLIIMGLLLRSGLAIVLITAMIGLSIVSTLGIFGWLGYQMTPPTGFVPIAVMTIAVADAIHILISYNHRRRHGDSSKMALRDSLTINFSPVMVTSLTTIIGVLCLNTSDSPPYRDMGSMIAVGVLIAWLLTLTFLPACIRLLPIFANNKDHRAENRMLWLSRLILNRPKRWAITIAALVIVCVGIIPSLVLSENWHQFFDEDYEVRRATNQLQESVGGLHSFFVIADSGRQHGIAEPVFLQAMAKFCHWLRQQDEVNQVSCLSDTIQQLHQKLQNDEPEYYRIPDSAELTAQLLLLYELSLPSGLGMDQQLTHDKRYARLQINLPPTDSTQLLHREQNFRNWAATHAPELGITELTGLDIVFANLTYRNITGMLIGTALALILISLVMFVALSSWRLGLLSLIPNLFPAVVAYGCWAFINGTVDTATSVVACLSLGIIVDDTVHFLSKYRHARQTLVYSTHQALEYSFKTVGLALVITSAILIGGFLVLNYSLFNPTRDMGNLLAITLLTALIIDFILLPVLLLGLEKKRWITWPRYQQKPVPANRHD